MAYKNVAKAKIVNNTKKLKIISKSIGLPILRTINTHEHVFTDQK